MYALILYSLWEYNLTWSTHDTSVILWCRKIIVQCSIYLPVLTSEVVTKFTMIMISNDPKWCASIALCETCPKPSSHHSIPHSSHQRHHHHHHNHLHLFVSFYPKCPSVYKLTPPRDQYNCSSDITSCMLCLIWCINAKLNQSLTSEIWTGQTQQRFEILF